MGHKKPKHRCKPRQKPSPRTVADPNAYKTKKMRWSFELFDEQKKWWDNDSYRAKTFNDIAGHLKSFERRCWQDIEGNRKRDHAVTIDRLVPEARKRLQELKLEDCECLMRLRFTGTQRVWGFRKDYYFMILWWDPLHKVCPSKKKHT